MAPTDTTDTRPRHSIGAVSRRTGLSQLVLRAWERRYEVVVPGRTPTGRRLYSDRDVERLTLLRRLTDQGYRIGDVAALPRSELRNLADEADATATAGRPETAPGSPPPESHLQAALAAVQDLDSHRLEAVLTRASVDLSLPALRNRLILPLMEQIGEQWRQGTLRVAQEHMATTIVRTFIAALNSRQPVASGSPLLAVATPSGDLHEVGALLAASHALELGWDVLYLGPNLPAEEIAAAAAARHAQAVYISLVYPVDDAGISEQLQRLRTLVGEELPLLAGGRAAASYQQTLDRIGAVRVADAAALDRALGRGA